jgi:hypothetical protein
MQIPSDFSTNEFQFQPEIIPPRQNMKPGIVRRIPPKREPITIPKEVEPFTSNFDSIFEPTYYKPNPMPQQSQGYRDIRKSLEDFHNSNPTDLNSIYSSPEPIYNPADQMSYLNPQESRIPPRGGFDNTPFINAEPSISQPLPNDPRQPMKPGRVQMKSNDPRSYTRQQPTRQERAQKQLDEYEKQRTFESINYPQSLRPPLTTTFNTTAITPHKTTDDLIPSGMEDAINYAEEFTKLDQTEQKYGDLADMEQARARGDVDALNFANNELRTLNGPTDEFFDGNDLDPRQDFEYNPESGHSKMEEAKSSGMYDTYSRTQMDASVSDAVNSMGLGQTIDGLNLSGLGDRSLYSRTSSGNKDPYVNTNTNNLAGDLISSLNFQDLLLGENSIYNRTRDMDLLSIPDDEDGGSGNGGSGGGGGGGGSVNGPPISSSLNFKTLNKRQMNKNFKASKWQGTGQRPNLQPTLSDVRNSKVDFKIPSMTYKGNQVNLIRRANRTTDMNNSEMEP